MSKFHKQVNCDLLVCPNYAFVFFQLNLFKSLFDRGFLSTTPIASKTILKACCPADSHGLMPGDSSQPRSAAISTPDIPSHVFVEQSAGIPYAKALGCADEGSLALNARSLHQLPG